MTDREKVVVHRCWGCGRVAAPAWTDGLLDVLARERRLVAHEDLCGAGACPASDIAEGRRR